MKKCRKCKKNKDEGEFGNHKRGKNGLRSQCKACIKEQDAEYYKKNSEKIIKRTAVWAKNNPEKREEYQKEFKEDNPDYKKEYYQNHKIESDDRNKNWAKNNPEKRDIIDKRSREKRKKNNPNYQKEYQQTHKEEANKRHKERMATDSLYKLKRSIRSLIGVSLKNGNWKKNSRTFEILGCMPEEFKMYIEAQWIGDKSWMNWNNYGNPKDGLGVHELNKTWDYDHIIKMSTATTDEEAKILNHYTNLQPLCSYINRFVKK